MTISFGTAFSDAAALWRAERNILNRLAGLFFFLPSFALLMLLPEPQAGEATREAASRALVDYAAANVHWLIAANLVNLYGAATLLILFLDRSRPTVGEALGKASRIYPFYLLAAVSAGLLVMGGLFLFILPGLYVLGRTFLVSPVVVAERRQGPIEAVARSFELTRGNGWLLFTMAAMVFFSSQIISLIADTINRASEIAGGGSPVLAAIVNAIAAFASAAMSVVLLLLKIAVYRRVSSRGT